VPQHQRALCFERQRACQHALSKGVVPSRDCALALPDHPVAPQTKSYQCLRFQTLQLHVDICTGQAGIGAFRGVCE
jgi:hypothetical protein